jgi:hypothetical protein
VTVHVHIERLVLDGLQVPPDQRPIVQAALASELEHLVANYGLEAEALSRRAVTGAGPRTLGVAASDAARLGQQIAGAVYKDLGG